MSDKSTIEWTDATWNPTTGCTKVSEGCRHCYIDRTPPFRINGISFDKGEEIGATTGVQLHPDRLDQPLKWRKPKRIFVNSLSDLFHDDIPDEFIARVFQTMSMARQHTFQILTKRPRRMREFLTRCQPSYVPGDNPNAHTWVTHDGTEPLRAFNGTGIVVGMSERWPLPNVWLGTSVEDQKAADLRIPLLLETPAAVRFLSCEPLIGPVDLTWYLDKLRAAETPVAVECEHGYDACPMCDANRIHWVIVGGESGPKARPMHPGWARTLRGQCNRAGVPFFFKQFGNWVPVDPLDYRRGKDIAIKYDGSPDPDEFSMTFLRRVRNKHDAGRELDGRTWDEMPQLEKVTS